MNPTDESGITFAQLAGAYMTRRLSEEDFLTLCALVVDTPPSSSANPAPKPEPKWN